VKFIIFSLKVHGLPLLDDSNGSAKLTLGASPHTTANKLPAETIPKVESTTLRPVETTSALRTTEQTEPLLDSRQGDSASPVGAVEHDGVIGSDIDGVVSGEPGEVPGMGLRAMAVFGIASIVAIVYFYFKLRRIKARDQIQYGLLDDREFELRHLELDSDSSDEDDATIYTSRRNVRKPRR